MISRASPQSQKTEELLPGGSADVISAVRLILAPLALLVVSFDGFGAGEPVVGIRALLVLYAVYSFLLWIRPLQSNRFIQAVKRRAAWADAAWFTLLVAASNLNHQIIFFFGFFFAILSASFNSGYVSGRRVSISSAIAIALVAIALKLTEPGFGLSRLWGPLILLAAVGYFTDYFGRSRLRLKRQLQLLQDITSLSNPHFGIDRTLASVMESLRAFYAAETCVLIMAESESSSFRLRRADRHRKALEGEVISDELVQQLGGLASPKAVIYSRAPHGWPLRTDPYYEIRVRDDVADERAEENRSDKVATMLEAESFLAVPVCQYNRVVGRLYLASADPHAFVQSDASFVYQIIERLLPLIESIRLVDRLASEAAERERRRIACDIHDSVIQPYVGIQLGLTALRRKIERGERALDKDINTLMEMTDGEIFGLRRYMGALTSTVVTEMTLLDSVSQFARKFSAATGIAVEVRNGAEFTIRDRLAAEVLQMIVEGLSNIRRHTRTTRAIIDIGCDRECLSLQIEDEGSGGTRKPSFIPRSISTRAAALGGGVQVQRSYNGGTAISIKIPL